MSFWAQLTEEERQRIKELPPLTDGAVAAWEAEFAVKLPGALAELLRTRNGGYLENHDFTLQGEVMPVHEILGISLPQEYGHLGPFLFLEDADAEDTRKQLQKRAGDPSKLIQFASADYYSYMLDYNHLNSVGEPTVVRILLSDPEDIGVKRMADSFAEFMAGQYFGDAEPAVRLEEADKYQLVVEGGYNGKHQVTGRDVRIAWKICSHRNRLIVFERQEGWGEGEERERSELYKSDLALAFRPLEDYGVDLEPEFAENIRAAVEPELLAEFDAPVQPKCYEFVLHVVPRKKRLISKQTSEAFEGRWKNDKDSVLNTAVYSGDKAALEHTIDAVARSCTGLRRFFG